jgi:hypothetical protein
MPVAEIAAAITSSKAALDIAKAMVGLRDAETMRTKTIELQGLILEFLNKAIEAREAQSAQLNTISALETEITSLKAWDAEKQQYELTPIGHGGVAFMLKPEARSSKAPHWLCPTCFEAGKKSFFQPATTAGGFGAPVECKTCKSVVATSPGESPKWT